MKVHKLSLDVHTTIDDDQTQHFNIIFLLNDEEFGVVQRLIRPNVQSDPAKWKQFLRHAFDDLEGFIVPLIHSTDYIQLIVHSQYESSTTIVNNLINLKPQIIDVETQPYLY